MTTKQETEVRKSLEQMRGFLAKSEAKRTFGGETEAEIFRFRALYRRQISYFEHCLITGVCPVMNGAQNHF